VAKTSMPTTRDSCLIHRIWKISDAVPDAKSRSAPAVGAIAPIAKEFLPMGFFRARSCRCAIADIDPRNIRDLLVFRPALIDKPTGTCRSLGSRPGLTVSLLRLCCHFRCDRLVDLRADLIDREARGFLAWRIFDEGLEECRSFYGALHGQVSVLHQPIIILI
jgi:hypothetical protein